MTKIDIATRQEFDALTRVEFPDNKRWEDVASVHLKNDGIVITFKNESQIESALEGTHFGKTPLLVTIYSVADEEDYCSGDILHSGVDYDAPKATTE